MTTDNKKIVKDLIDACMNKDFDSVRRLTHKDYTLKDPMMTANGVDELIAMMENCPSDGKIENLEIYADGNTVISTFDGTNSEPPTRMRMCSIIQVENGKVKSEEMFYDSAKIPQDMKEQMKNTAPGKKAA
ncbi:MAG: nuclear transport factor 2 family protein [Alphaproteobacteria bacterium]